jgi:hypothetical protein
MLLAVMFMTTVRILYYLCMVSSVAKHRRSTIDVGFIDSTRFVKKKTHGSH